MDSKNVKDGKTIAIYLADEVAGFAIHPGAAALSAPCFVF